MTLANIDTARRESLSHTMEEKLTRHASDVGEITLAVLLLRHTSVPDAQHLCVCPALTMVIMTIMQKFYMDLIL